jgi:hypothetical protein
MSWNDVLVIRFRLQNAIFFLFLSLPFRNFQHIQQTNTIIAQLSKMSIDKRIEELNLVLPPASTPAGIYIPALRVGNQMYVSGE